MSFQNLRALIVALAILAVSAEQLLAQVSFQNVASGLSNPLYATAPDGDGNRLFIVEQGGGGTARIKIYDRNTGSVLPTPYQTITGLTTGGERGLLGLAFDPDFANNGYYYVYASVPGGTQNHMSEVRRYQAVGDPMTSNTGGAGLTKILEFSQPFSNHNGGWMGFNPKVNPADPQYLYIATGDGGSGGDPQNNAQDITNNRLGKMLRIDPSGDDFPADPNRNYTIPASNPFVGVTGDDEIWSYGLRNPWRNSFDRKTGDLYIADVGQGQIEEINFQIASSNGGENYGWRVHEGTSCYDNSQTGGNPPCGHPGFTFPIHEYNHVFNSTGGFSITGGYVYRGDIEQFQGLYFFGDFVTRNIWTLDPLAEDVAASVVYRNSELGGVGSPAGFGEDADGNLYVTDLNGSIYLLETTAKTAVWHGDDPASGLIGDGVLWTNARNWERDGFVDSGQVSGDPVVFIGVSSTNIIDLNGDKTVASATFEADFTLNSDTLWVQSGNIDVDPGVTATINSNLRAETLNASIRKHGEGTLIANGSTNEVIVFEGTLGGTGPFAHITALDGAAVAPGNSIGVMNVSNTATFEPGSTLEMEIANTGAPGIRFDLLDVRSSAQLDGTLDLQLVQNYAPQLGDTFAIITSPSISGTFANVTNVVQAGNLGLAVRYSPTVVDVRVSIRGDTDFDDDVDTSDLTAAIIGFTGAGGVGNTWVDGDFDGDGDTDTSDLTAGIINFTGASAANPNVPDLVYDPATGNVTIDADGADMISFSLQSGPFAAADFGGLPDGLTDNIANQIGWTSFNLFTGLTGTADLGAILPAGLDLAQLEAALTTASYGLALSGGGGGGRFDIIIPEPGTLALLLICTTTLARRRRRIA